MGNDTGAIRKRYAELRARRQVAENGKVPAKSKTRSTRNTPNATDISFKLSSNISKDRLHEVMNALIGEGATPKNVSALLGSDRTDVSTIRTFADFGDGFEMRFDTVSKQGNYKIDGFIASGTEGAKGSRLVIDAVSAIDSRSKMNADAIYSTLSRQAENAKAAGYKTMEIKEGVIGNSKTFAQLVMSGFDANISGPFKATWKGESAAIRRSIMNSGKPQSEKTELLKALDKADKANTYGELFKYKAAVTMYEATNRNARNFPSLRRIL